MASAGETSGALTNEQRPPEVEETIFRVPDPVRAAMKSAYEPTKLFLGPYHHMKSSGGIQSKYKLSLLQRYPRATERDYSAEVNEVYVKAIGCYSDLKTSIEYSVKMMTDDACVIVEMINKLIRDDETKELDWEEVDPILEEMMLLENQIPFIVLEKIWEVSGAKEERGDLVSHFLWLMRDKYSPDPGVSFPIERNTPVFHLVHLLQLVMFPSPGPTLAPSVKSLPCLRELLKRGVQLKRNDQARGLKVSFSEGVLTINPLKITASTEKYIGNLIAFEQCYKSANRYASNYFKLMGSLIEKQGDVDALVSAKILSFNEGYSEHIVLNLFKTLADGISEYKVDEGCNPAAIIEWVNKPENSYNKIFRVPDHIRNLKPSAYEPTLISFGPYHHGKERLKSMERQKWSYRDKLLQRYTDKTWENCMNAVKEIEDQLRQFYEGPIELGTHDDFVEVMTLDGCFQIEIITNKTLIQTQPDPELERQTLGVIHRDMMLIENQIPFNLLWTISEYLGGNTLRLSLEDKLCKFARDAYYGPNSAGYRVTVNMKEPPDIKDILHLVDLLGHYMFPTSDNADGQMCGILSLSQLTRRGLKVVVETTNRGLGVSFKDGKLSVNQHRINMNTDMQMRNLIAFEQNYWGAKKRASSYAVLMNYLIRSSEDVNVLSSRNANILRNNLTSEEEVVDLFKNLCKGIKDFEAGTIYEDLWKYGTSNSREWLRELRENYFRSPWSIFALLGALVLLLLTLTQTFFSIWSWQLAFVQQGS